MILAVGTWPFGSAPQAALVLNITLAGLIPVLAFDLGRRLAGHITGVSAALLLTMMPLLVIAFSMESYLYVAFILGSLDAYVSGRYRLAGVLVGLTALVRGDGVLLSASLLTYDLLAYRQLRWRLIIPAITIPAGWYLFATLYYGSPFPATLAAKTAQGEFNWLGEYFLSGFREFYWKPWLEDYGLVFYLFPILIFLGLIRAVLTERRWLILIIRDALYVLTFVGLGVTFAAWYYAPLMPGLVLLTGRGIQFVANSVARLIFHPRPGSNNQTARRATFLSLGLATSLTVLLLVAIYPVTNDIIEANPDWKARAYPDAARWIASNTNASANLATIDIGHLGYWSGRHMIDIVGLAQPDVAPHIATGDFGFAIRRYEPDMVLIGASWLPEVQSHDWFQAAYAPRQALKFNGLDEPLVLFTRLDGVKVHSQRVPSLEIQPLQADFNHQVSLTGFHVNQPAQGGLLNLTLYWQVDAPLEIDFTVFVQLVDRENNILAQGDAKPQRGFYRTTYWQPGEQVIDSFSLQLEPEIPAGDYDILVGLYEADNGARLQILDDAGQFVSDHVRLSRIRIHKP
jgi:hypothetical protein